MNHEMIGTPEARAWLLVFESGDQVSDELLRFALEADVRACHISGIGAFSECRLAFFDRASRAYEEIPIDEQVEVLSLLGNLTIGPGGEHRLHAHATVGRRDGTTLGGHLLAARVWPTLELFVTESRATIQRRVDEESGLPLCTLE